jgi:hypothetical protein
MNVELLNSRGELLNRFASRREVEVNSEDISASEVYRGTTCPTSTCPVTRIWIKPGREARYIKR